MIRDASSVAEAIERVAGAGVTIVTERPISGGCIADGRRIELSNGESYFLKRSAGLPPQMFVAEAAGLEALADCGGPRVPRAAAVHAAEHGSFILMEWIEHGSRGAGFAREFGTQLAALHRTRRVDRFGFDMDNFIGSTPQPNGWMDSWHDFYRERRIGFQTRLARDRGMVDTTLVRRIDQILARLEDLLPAPEFPSLLHGDLWGGNYIVDDRGGAVLIDPAVWYGHREADLAMTELFGGFPSGFYESYREAWPLTNGYADRVPLYNLYHLLNHANIFGQGYVSSVRSIVNRFQ